MVHDFLKVEPQGGETAIKYLSRALTVDTAAVAVKDYFLSALLLDKRLEEFADSLPRFYNVSDTANLPLHYREAMLLCSKVFPDKELLFVDVALDKRYAELLKLHERINAPEAFRYRGEGGTDVINTCRIHCDTQ